jgi:hypothetical protein
MTAVTNRAELEGMIVRRADGALAFVDAEDPAHVSLAALIAGERLPGSATNGYQSVKSDWNYTRVDLAPDAAVTINNGPTILGKVYVDTVLSAHACPFLDGATTVFSLIASLAAGTSFVGMEGTRFETSLIVDSNNSATGVIVVQWRPL